MSPIQQLKERAIVGHSVVITGDITGQEDLLILGTVKGKIDLNGHNVTVGEKGTVRADINARMISVEGTVNGNLVGEEKIMVRKNAVVKGNLSAPRISLEDGCKFSGKINIDVQEPKAAKRPTVKPPEKSEPLARDEKTRPTILPA